MSNRDATGIDWPPSAFPPHCCNCGAGTLFKSFGTSLNTERDEIAMKFVMQNTQTAGLPGLDGNDAMDMLLKCFHLADMFLAVRNQVGETPKAPSQVPAQDPKPGW